MAQPDGKQLTTEQQKNQDIIDSINAKVNACEKDWGQFEDLCWNTLRNMGLWLYVGAVDTGTKKVTSFEKLSIDQILSEIDGKDQTLYSYLRDHPGTVNGEHKTEIRGHNRNGKSTVKWAVGPSVTFKKAAGTAPRPNKTGTTTAPSTPTPTSSLTKDILTALPSMVSAFQLLQPKPNNNDNKLILDFMKMQQENAHREQERLDRLESQRRADKKEMQELAQSLAARSPISDLAELEEFRQQVSASTRADSPPIAGVNAPGTTSSGPWDKLAELGGKYLESAMAAHNQRQAEAQQAESIDAKRAEISELAAETEITVQDYLNDLTQLIQAETEAVAILKGIQQLLTFAKENDQLDQIPELTENEYDVEMALLTLLDSRTENKEYIQQVMKTAEPFLPLVSAELGIIDKELTNGHNEELKHNNTIGFTPTSEEPQPQEAV